MSPIHRQCRHRPLRRRARAAVAILLATALCLGFSAPARADAPALVVADFHADLLEAMKNAEKLGIAGRYRLLEASVAEAFDLTRMIRIASGKNWKSTAEADRARLLEAFRKMSVATYASQFDGFSGETFSTVGERPGPQGTILVATRIDSPGGDGADLTYVMIETGGRWRIADVLLDNAVSQLAVRRSEYRRVLQEKGVAGLIALLGAKADALLGR